MVGNSIQSPAPVTGSAQVTVLKRMVSGLASADLDELYRHITILRRLSGKPEGKSGIPGTTQISPADNDWQERIIYDALAIQVAHQLGAKSAMPLSAFRKTSSYSQWSAAVVCALEQHHGWFPKATRPETISMLWLYADMVIGNLNSPEHPHGFGWRSVCWGLENLAVIVDKNFPDYARNGLLPLVASLRTNPRLDEEPK